MPDPVRPAVKPQSKSAAQKGGAAAIAVMIAGVIAVEGGYVNHPADPGGETNMGITKKVAVQNGYQGPMRTLPREIAEGIYYRQYIVAPGYEPLVAIDAPVTEELFDTSVNMGPPRPSRWFQQSIGEICGTTLIVDGKVGKATINAYQVCQPRLGAARLCVSMLDSLDAKQRAEYERLVRANPKLGVFLKGWIANRINNVDRGQCSALDVPGPVVTPAPTSVAPAAPAQTEPTKRPSLGKRIALFFHHLFGGH